MFETKQAKTVLGFLVLVAIVAVVPHVFAITYTDADNPSGPLQGAGWATGLAIAAVLSGIGVWTAVRRH